MPVNIDIWLALLWPIDPSFLLAIDSKFAVCSHWRTGQIECAYRGDMACVFAVPNDSRLKPIRACALMWGISRTGICKLIL